MSNEYKDWLNDLTTEQRANYALCMQFPILIPHKEVDNPNFEYEYTALDIMPDGWRKAFGNEFANDLQKYVDLMNPDDKEHTYIIDMKEKYGYLHIYLSRYTPFTRSVCVQYADKSRQTCIHCGKPATKVTTGWVSPWCDECAEQHQQPCVPIKDFYKDLDHQMIE